MAGASIAVGGSALADVKPVLSGTAWFNGSGVNVCSDANGAGSDPTCGGQKHVGGVAGAWWQCVELAQRLYQSMGWYSGVFKGVSSADEIYTKANDLGMTRQANGKITSIVPGDMIVHGTADKYSKAGHVAIINYISGATVHAVQQNVAGKPTVTYTLRNGTLSGGSGTDILGVVHSPKDAPPKTVYAITFAGDSSLYSLSPRSHKISRKGLTGLELTDIAFRGKTLYAISFTDLYRLSTATGASKHVGPLGVVSAANALATQPKTNILYGADQYGDFFKVNQNTGRATVIGTFGAGLGSAGDLAFAAGRLYAIVSKDGSAESYLATVNVRTGAAKIVGNTGYQNVWGLVPGNGVLYGAANGGLFLTISKVTGHAKALWKERLAIGGLATP